MRALCGVAAAAAALVVPAAAGAGHPPPIRRTEHVARVSPCNHPPRTALTYHYPIRPFDRQHPIRGFFGDPRTFAESPIGDDSPRSAGSFTFHNGVDIAAPTGTRVYPVVSGVVTALLYADEVTVSTSDERRFQYFHIRPRVRLGERVVVDRTVLGTVGREWLHVHLTEIDVFRPHNPLDPGHLEPYRDHTAPAVDGLVFRNAEGRDTGPLHLHGLVRIAADAEDRTPVPVPGTWFGFPVTPAYVAWHLSTPSGKVVVPTDVVADFRRTEPYNRDFWRVYAPGTYQNFPVFGRRFYWHVPGRYLFNLTPRPLDTLRLADGSYRLTVNVADTCGNRGSLTEAVSISNER